MGENINCELEILDIISFCPMPLTKTLLSKMDKKFLIPIFEEKKDSYENNKINIYITLDNHLVKSSYELLISNFFYLNDIEYSYDQVIIKGKTSFRYDYKIKKYYWEIFGYYGDAYNKRKEEKIAYYEANKLELIKVDSKFFECKFLTIYEKLIELCIKYGIKTEGFKEYNPNQFLYGSRDYLGFISSVLKDYIDKTHTLPNSDELREMGFNGLERSINKLGGFKEVCIQLGLDDQKFRNSWNDVNSKHEFLLLCEKVKGIPTDKDYEKYNLAGLRKYLRSNGTKKELEELAGFNGYLTYNDKHNIKPSGYWTFPIIIKEIKPLSDHLKRTPSKTDLIEAGLDYLEGPINRLTSRVELSRELQLPMSNSNMKSYTYTELLDVLRPISDQLGFLPSTNELKNRSLSHWVNHYGGVNKIANDLNVTSYSTFHGKKENGFWLNEHNREKVLKKRLLPIIEYLGYIPSDTYLREGDFWDIIQLIRKIGGRDKLSEILGYPTYNKAHEINESGYWDPEGKVLKTKLLPICENLGHIPSFSYLTKNKDYDIISGIRAFKGSLEQLTGYLSAENFKGIAPSGSNYDLEYLRSFIETIIQELKHFPNPTELADRGLKKLEKAIRNLGGRNKLAVIFNTITYRESLKKR